MIILEEGMAATTNWQVTALAASPPAGVKVPLGLDDTATVLGSLDEVGQAKSSQ